MERYQLVHRDEVPDNSMRDYRVTMGPHWFPNDLKAQSDYAGLPDNSNFGNATNNLCLMNDKKVIGTISLYDFAKVRNKNNLTNNELLNDLPLWLRSFVYQGDISTIPESQRQGLSNLMINETIKMASKTEGQRTVFGIIKNTNIPMKNLIEKLDGNFIERSNCLFVKFSETHRPSIMTRPKGEIVKLHFDDNFPPVIQMFYNQKGVLEAATIATSPNVPGNTDARPTGKIEELYHNQCVGIINPDLNEQQTKKLITEIYSSIGRFKYASLYQMSNENTKIQLNEPTLSGFEQNWSLYRFNLN
jgi:hypothetical protein